MSLSAVLYNSTDLQSVYLVEISALSTVKFWNYTDLASGLLDDAGNFLVDDSGDTLGPIETGWVYWTPFPFDGEAFVTGANFNETPLTLVHSPEAVVGMPNSYYWDQVNVYINLAAGADPRQDANTVTLELTFYLADHGDKIFNGIFYHPVLVTVPGISLRVEQDFSGVGQIAGGTTTFDNSPDETLHGFFDSYTDLDWDGGQTVILLGADNPALGQFMDYADYERVGTWLNDNWQKTNQQFIMNNLETKQQLTQNLPQNIYSTDLYPGMNSQDSAIGTPVPWAYGLIYGAPAVCIDVGTNRFKVADHAIFSIDEVRTNAATTWDTISVGAEYLSAGEFLLPGWDGQSAVSVDFHGKPNADGSWMSNASDMMLDLLAQCGQTEVNTGSFSTSRQNLVIGGTTPATEQSMLVPSLFLNTTQTLAAVAQIINQVVGSYLFVDANGLFNYVVFVPLAGEGLPLFDDLSILDFSEVKPNLQCQSEVTINYATRTQDKWGETLVVDKVATQYSKNQPSLTSVGPQNIGVSNDQDAEYWATRNLVFLGQKPGIYTINLPWSALLLLPTNQIHIQYARHNLDDIFEIVEVDKGSAASSAGSNVGSYGATGVEVTLSNLHNFSNKTGFWVEEDGFTSGEEGIPVRFANLAGYGTGSLDWNDAWDPAIKAWAIQNCGWWSDDNGFVDSADPDSELVSGWF